MKKILSSAIALMVILSCVFALSACGGSDSDASIPDGYKEYTFKDISFAHPEDWTSSGGSVTIIMDANSAGDNVTVAYEPKNDLFDDLTLDEFNTVLKPTFEAMGLSISDAEVDSATTNGLDVTIISYKASVSGTKLYQTLFVTTIGDYTYTVTTTSTSASAEFIDVVLDTLCEA